MDHTNNNNGPEESDLRPPPYSPAMYQDGFYTGTTYQVGNNNQTFVLERLHVFTAALTFDHHKISFTVCMLKFTDFIASLSSYASN